MFLRAYRPEDKRPLQQLFFDTVHTVNARDYTPEQLAAWAPTEPDRLAWSRLDGQFCFVVESQKMLVGFASLHVDGQLDFLSVHPDFQSKGVATALYNQVERLARKRNFPLLQAEASITACSFLEKNGFVMVREFSKTLRGVEFLQYRMEKPLQPAASTNGLQQSQPG